jgi:hypothetical protein
LIVDSITGLDTAGVVKRNTLGEGIFREIFEAIPILKAIVDDDDGFPCLISYFLHYELISKIDLHY